MDLYIVRHGEAQPAEETPDGSDAARALTPDGRRKTARTARALAELGAHPGVILSSPLTRARETSDVLAAILVPAAGVVVEDSLLPDAPVRQTVLRLARREESGILVVGHMPHLAALASLLLCGRPSADIVLKKSSACALSFGGRAGGGRGRLEWLLQPRHLRALAAKRGGAARDDGE